MADNTTKTSTTTRRRSTTGTRSASRSTASRSTASRSTASRTTSKPAAEAQRSATNARRQRTTATRETREAATAGRRAAKATAAEGRSYAERAIFAYTGAVLEARDNVVGFTEDLVKRYGSVAAAQKELQKAQRTLSRDLTKFERRGEREVRRPARAWSASSARRRRSVEGAVRVRGRRIEKRADAATDVLGGQVKATGEQIKETGEQIRTLV